MSKKGILLIVSGFSGSGKGTLMKKLLSEYDNYALSISATTRKPRPGEEHAREYFFLEKEEFEKRIATGEFLEYANYVGNYYGTPRTYVEEQIEQGKDVILEIEIQGALQIREHFPEAVLLFVSAPSADELKNRLIGRGSEELAVVEERLARAVEESKGIEKYKYFVINDDIDTCVKQVHAIVGSEHYLVSQNIEKIETIQKEIQTFQKG